jgi:hypothetical protein
MSIIVLLNKLKVVILETKVGKFLTDSRIFFWVPFMKNINLNILKIWRGKVCKIWCNDVYMSILQYDIFWWKLIMTAFIFFIFKSAGEGEGWFEGDPTWLIHYTKKHQKTQTAIQLYCLIPSNSVLQLYSFDSGYFLNYKNAKAFCYW